LAIAAEVIERLYTVEKYCTEEIVWQSVTTAFSHHRFIVPVVTIDEDLLKWVGYAQTKYGVRRFGFSLTYKRKFVVRSWDLAKQHWSKKDQRYVRGMGRHKHYHLDLDTPRDVYEIPEGEISTSDPNQALIDFAKECNIKILIPHQTIL
jgi:hypothetical protein